MNITLGNIPIYNNQIVPEYLGQLPLGIKIPVSNQLQTLIVYDAKTLLIHFLEINIINDYSEIVTSLIPLLKDHTYVVDLFVQSHMLNALSFNPNIMFYVSPYGLIHKERFIFTIDPERIGNSEADNKYCRCVEEVKAKGPQVCSSGPHCNNPYAICHASIQGESGRPQCG